MRCTCGRPLSVAFALYGSVWSFDGRLYCCRGCAAFPAEGFGAPDEPVRELALRHPVPAGPLPELRPLDDERRGAA